MRNKEKYDTIFIGTHLYSYASTHTYTHAIKNKQTQINPHN